MTIDGDHPRLRMRESDIFYYVIEGSGWFQLGDQDREEWSAGQYVLVPSDTEFSYGGELKYLNIQAPAFKPENATWLD